MTEINLLQDLLHLDGLDDISAGGRGSVQIHTERRDDEWLLLHSESRSVQTGRPVPAMETQNIDSLE